MEGSMEDLVFKPAGVAMAALLAGISAGQTVDLAAQGEAESAQLAADLNALPTAEPLAPATPQQLDLFADVPLG
jgi:hypothetical protein